MNDLELHINRSATRPSGILHPALAGWLACLLITGVLLDKSVSASAAGKSAIPISGQVVDGVTGEPLSDAALVLWRARGPGGFSLPHIFEDSFWRQVHSLAPYETLEGKSADRLLKDRFVDSGILRIGPNGDFVFKYSHNQSLGAFYLMAPERLPHRVSLSSSLLQDGNGKTKESIDLGQVPLFPAATVTVQPRFTEEPNARWLAVTPRWDIAHAVRPMEGVHTLEPNHGRISGDCYAAGWMEDGETYHLFLPAGVPLTLDFRPSQDDVALENGPYSLHLDPGESYDLEGPDLVLLPKVEVVVIDHRGRPVKGVPIRFREVGQRTWLKPIRADADGISHVPVNPRTGTDIVIRVISINQPRAAVPKFGDIAEIGPIRFELSREQYRQLRNNIKN